MSEKSAAKPTALSLPKGGGAIKGIGETFQANLFSGTANHSVPIALSPGRNGFEPKLSLEYSSGNGNGAFGLGWQITLPRITRKTEKGLPRYDDDDVFVMSGVEDLVRRLRKVVDPDSGRETWAPEDAVAHGDFAGFCCKNSLTIQDVETTTSSSLLQNVAKIFFATEPWNLRILDSRFSSQGGSPSIGKGG
jgi:Salmonella virulence plasmid 65kDa B protein